MRQYLARQRQQGLSLIELLVTMTIAVILLAVGVPSFIEFTTSNTASSYANDLLGDLNYARSEAITRGSWVVVCKGATANNCTTDNWEDGWKVFEDCNNDQTVDTGTCPDRDLPGTTGHGTPDDETVLRRHGALSNGWTLRGNNNVSNRVTYQATGRTGNNGTFSVCRNTEVMSTELSRAVIIHGSGRVRIATDTDANGKPDESDGTEITDCTP